jgi:nucleoside-diphosphate-sugar epimerase
MVSSPAPRSQASLSVRRAIAGRHLLVTGVTGFLGKVWLAMVLELLPEVGKLSVLVRGRRKESASARFAKIVETSPVFRSLRARHGAGLERFLNERLEVLDGDVQLAGCGLDATKTSALAGSVDAIVHFAGLTDFEPDPVTALAVNTHGATHVADLAVKIRAPLVHVSTCFVAGNVSGEIPETITQKRAPNGVAFDVHEEITALSLALDAAVAHLVDRGSREARQKRIDAASERARRLGWPNIYTYTKGLAEHLLAARDDVRAIVVRPSIVECATDYPFVSWNEGINTSGPLFWLLGSFFRRLPSRPEHRFDVVPVDAVARGVTIALASLLAGEALPTAREGAAFALASSWENPFTFGRAIELTSLSARSDYGRSDAKPLERFVLRYLDAVPVDAETERFPSMSFLRKAAKGLRDALSDVDRSDIEERWGKLVDRMVGEQIDDALSTASRALNRADRTLGSIEQMLRLYKPFIHDNDYVFRTDRISALAARLVESEREAFGWHVAKIDWRHYWVDVEGPGLRKWCFPLLRGEKAPEDPLPEGPRLSLQFRGRAVTLERTA